MVATRFHRWYRPGSRCAIRKITARGKEWFCAGDGTQNSRFGAALGEPLAGESEAGSAEHRQENSNNGREDALLPFKLYDGVEQLLVVLLYGLDGDDGTRTTAPPSRHGGARDGDVLGQASGAGTDHVVSKTVVVRAAGPWRCRGDVYHHESITDLGSPTKNSTILGLSKLRTRLCERSAHTAGLGKGAFASLSSVPYPT